MSCELENVRITVALERMAIYGKALHTGGEPTPYALKCRSVLAGYRVTYMAYDHAGMPIGETTIIPNDDGVTCTEVSE